MTAEKQEKPQFDQGAIIKALQNALRTTSSKIGQLNEVLDIVRVVGEAKTFKTAALALAGDSTGLYSGHQSFFSRKR